MKDATSIQLAAQIEELRRELNRAVQRNRLNLHVPSIQVLSTRLDGLITEFMSRRETPGAKNPPPFPRPAPLSPRQAYGNPLEVFPKPATSCRAWLQEEFGRSKLDAMRLIPWGTHLCQFYFSRQDLIDVVVPYFRAGLENDEFCIWIVGDSLSRTGAMEAMAAAVPGFESHIEKGQMEIISCSEWYVKNGAFNSQRVLRGWAAKLCRALSRGYAGMRISGETGWLEPKDWAAFAAYEKQANELIRGCRVKALCCYPIDKCGHREIEDVLREHRLAFIKDSGGWQLV
ncbi:MAG: MEDS domain-containing protein [Firmicutes bacterium]|nr:MEDS domain-containing protein [Bacillota bacterium]MDH7494712.1 MEDS domain-containing protein [Bacillota bacterium]